MTNNEDLNNKHTSDNEDKIDLILQQNEAIQRSIAYLKADLPDVIKESINTILTKRKFKGVTIVHDST